MASTISSCLPFGKLFNCCKNNSLNSLLLMQTCTFISYIAFAKGVALSAFVPFGSDCSVAYPVNADLYSSYNNPDAPQVVPGYNNIL